MSIVNCTPDSFYAPSRSPSPEDAAERALEAEALGADIVDFGAESTRPGALPIDEEEEIRRLLPALKLFRKKSSLPVSVDTSKTNVARFALDEGANIINDVSSPSEKGMIGLCAERNAAIILMYRMAFLHKKTAIEPENYADEIKQYFIEVAKKAVSGGIKKEKIILDPGFGFNKSTGDNLVLLNDLAIIRPEDYPLLIGLSRKRFIGEITGRDAEDRLGGTITANVLALTGGADIIRVHDTAEAVDAVKIFTAMNNSVLKGKNELV